ncbi:MAG: sigma-70 family RNA polymerase sigma factor [Pseudomonadota bacterium]
MPTNADLARVFRAESGRILSVLLAQYRDMDLAEEALQDACLQASEQWPSKGVPQNSAGWLLTVARRRLIDRLRKSTHANKEEVIQAISDSLTATEQIAEEAQEIPDERLKLIFVCCHPALAENARVALTLKTLCGLTVPEISRAYLLSESALHQRLSRAKRKIKKSGIAYEVPQDQQLAERVSSVLEVIYLIFNESYTAFEGQSLTRVELAEEALRLARVLYRLLPRPDVAGLLALMLLHHARHEARSSDTRAFIPLAEQDRRLWDQEAISMGRQLLLTAMAKGQAEKYQIQAAISALHAEADCWENTDWAQIQLLYYELYKQEPSPIVELNRIVAMANSGREQQALQSMQGLAEELEEYQPYHAALADLAAKLGDNSLAHTHFANAIAMTKNNAERDYLVQQLAALESE